MGWSNTDKSFPGDNGQGLNVAWPGRDSQPLQCSCRLQPGRVLVKGMYSKRRNAIRMESPGTGRIGGFSSNLKVKPSGNSPTINVTSTGGPTVNAASVRTMKLDSVVPSVDTSYYESQNETYNKATWEEEDYELAKYGYGKNSVKVLHVQRQGARHTIREYEVDTRLRLHTQKDYLQGDNRDIIATDTQKNTVYILAKKYGVESPEDFALLVCSHFLYTYRHVDEVSVHVEEYPWERLQVDGVDHNHAFIMSPKAYRFCTVTQKRNESPCITGGMRDLRVLKTTQSSFTDFIQDDYRTLPDVNDRIFSTVVTASWEYSTATGVKFDEVWDMVKECILDKFAGPPEEGIFSPSVQNTLYLTEKMVLDNVKQIRRIEMQMPNKHYFTLDMSKFPKTLVGGENKEVYEPVDKPSGIIHAVLERKKKSKL